jgi:hypothetical protein
MIDLYDSRQIKAILRHLQKQYIDINICLAKINKMFVIFMRSYETKSDI